MSTARTPHGCMAEDYAEELATICEDWLNGDTSAHPQPEEGRLAAVAHSFILAVRNPREDRGITTAEALTGAERAARLLRETGETFGKDH